MTEGGYYLDPDTGGLDASNNDIQYDAENPDHPRTAFGAIVAALQQRKRANLPAFTGLCCDNLQGNGDILRQTIVGLARLSDPDLADWIENNARFPNSMVDCIVPATGPNEILLARECGIDDAAPVTHENFRQWVIEDNFCMGRPDWDKVGATFTDDVHVYETMKLRILNAGHQVIANIGELLSVKTISGCMAHPLIAALFNKVEQTEIAPHVAAVPGMTADQYIELISRRFSNQAIVDTTRRVAFDGSSRHPGFLLPVIRDAIETGTAVEGLALVEALWARMCEGTREDGSVIEANDPHWETLQEAARQARSNPQVWLQQKFLYGDLADDEGFAVCFGDWLSALWKDGVENTVTRYVGKIE